MAKNHSKRHTKVQQMMKSAKTEWKAYDTPTSYAKRNGVSNTTVYKYLGDIAKDKGVSRESLLEKPHKIHVCYAKTGPKQGTKTKTPLRIGIGQEQAKVKIFKTPNTPDCLRQAHIELEKAKQNCAKKAAVAKSHLGNAVALNYSSVEKGYGEVSEALKDVLITCLMTLNITPENLEDVQKMEDGAKKYFCDMKKLEETIARFKTNVIAQADQGMEKILHAAKAYREELEHIEAADNALNALGSN